MMNVKTTGDSVKKKKKEELPETQVTKMIKSRLEKYVHNENAIEPITISNDLKEDELMAVKKIAQSLNLKTLVVNTDGVRSVQVSKVG